MRFTLLLILAFLACICWCQNNTAPPTFGYCKEDCNDGLVCLNHTCQYCDSNAQCESQDSQTRCVKSQYLKLTEYLCLHKSLFGSRLDEADVLSFIIFFAAAAISAGGGVGGGGIFVPILILISGFTPKEAVPLSNIIVSGASVANFVQNFAKRHPNSSSRPLIDYVVALLIEPQTLGGTVVGVYLHQIFPNWMILLLLIIVMSLTTIRTTMKGVTLYRAEDVKRKGISEHTRLINSSKIELPKEKLIMPWTKLAALVIVLVVSTILSIFKGGSSDKSVIGVEACSAWYWVIAVAIFPVIFAVWSWEGHAVIKDTQYKLANNLPFVFGDVKWTVSRVGIVGFVSFLAGILASLLGVGGGLIKGPVLIELGLPPEVVAATSSYMILFTSVSASIQYILIGKIMWDYGIVLFSIGLIASFAGQTLLNIIVERYERKSYIIFVIAMVIGASAILLILSEAVQFKENGGNNGFHWACPDQTSSPSSE